MRVECAILVIGAGQCAAFSSEGANRVGSNTCSTTSRLGDSLHRSGQSGTHEVKGACSMRIEQLGHAVLKVRDIGKAEEFYNGLLGLPVAARQREGLAMTFFTLGNHHDFAVVEVGPDGPDAPADAPGLFHVAFKVGDSLDQLRSVKAELEATGVTIDMIADHAVSQSIYIHDPDGNGIELYVDTSDVWRSEPQAVTTIQPLSL